MDDTTYLIDEFVGTRLGTPYRLFPFGKIVKGGKTREITPEIASAFKLPHFKPAIKLGSHEEPTPAGGHIVALEVRDDGLYAIPEWNDKGEQAVNDGAYRYHSPEVIWSDGAIEDPNTGEFINGPLIVGDALLHMPHLGEAAKLYSVEKIHEGDTKMGETIEVPKSFWETILEKFGAQPQPEPQPAPEPVDVTQAEEFKAIAQERDDFKVELEALKADMAKAELLSALVAELQDKEKFGMQYVELKGAQEAAEVLAGMNENQREWVMRNFKALVAQAKLGNVEQELGDNGAPVETDPVAAFDAAIKQVQAEKKVDYAAAVREVVSATPELYEAYKKAKEQ